MKIDDIADIDRYEAVKGVFEVAKNEGLLICLSFRPVYAAYKKVREKYGEGVYILVFPDDAFKYVEILQEYIQRGRKFNIQFIKGITELCF